MKILFEKARSSADYLALSLSKKAAPSRRTTSGADLGSAVWGAIDRVRHELNAGDPIELVGLEDAPRRIGLFEGPQPDRPFDVERFGAGAVKAAAARGANNLAIIVDGLDPVRVAGGALLASYRFDRYRHKWLERNPAKGFRVETTRIVCSDPASAAAEWDLARGRFEGANWARDLVNEPPNRLTPRAFAEACASLRDLGVEVTVWSEDAMRDLRMNALLAVGAGSEQESLLVALTWRGGRPDEPFTAFVGKGVTFDTGGISIKPAMGMEDMKCDMSGAAAIAGALHAIAVRKARANVIGVLALAENMPDGKAQRPSDIVESMSGQTIEVVNTDAEGRMILADALTWVQRAVHPSRVIDIATLTGAMVISLGRVHAGLFCNSDALAADIEAAGRAEGETVWRMPLDPAYDKLMDSDFADMKNAYVKDSGAITTAQFLQRFVETGAAWAHLDIAGVATRPVGDDPRFPVWATGWGVRLMDRIASGFDAPV